MTTSYHIHRSSGSMVREPRMSIQEAASEIGCSVPQMRAYVRNHGGPKPELKFRGSNLSSGRTYYRRSEMLAFIRKLSEIHGAKQ